MNLSAYTSSRLESIMSQEKFVTAICPTYKHPKLLANTLAMWMAQEYPMNKRELVILDDGQTFTNQQGVGYTLWSYPERMPSLTAKHNELLKLIPEQTDVLMIWDDDDIYLPSYLQWHLRALESSDFSKPSCIYSDFGRHKRGTIVRENSAGRFHSSIAFTRDLVQRVGGWDETLEADFDQQFIAKLTKAVSKVGDPCNYGPIQFVYSWETGHSHCSALMKNPKDETWYEEHGKRASDDFVGTLRPEYDRRTLEIMWELKAHIPNLEIVNAIT
jgi:hypothetical protein